MGREEFDKKLIGLYGEMELAIRLHKQGWQVYRAYIDELIDFVISKYYCKKCEKYTNLFERKEMYKGKNRKCKTNLCQYCESDSVVIKTKFIQVKTSAGVEDKFSFHPKLSHLIQDLFCVWIAMKNFKELNNIKCDFFIFKGLDIPQLGNIELDSYQITDNQKIDLKIDETGKITTNSIKNRWNKLNEYRDFNILE